MREEFPGFRVVRKDRSWGQRVIAGALVVGTLGGMRSYLRGYQTTIGWTVYVTPDFEERDEVDRWIVMRHERVHLRQFRRYTRVGMGVLYLLAPLPVGLAWFRARFEREAYEETMRAAAEVHGLEYVRRQGFRDYIVRQFMGPSYGWMWPFRRSVNRWYDRVLSDLEMQLGSQHG